MAWIFLNPSGHLYRLRANAGHSPGLGQTWALGRGQRLKLRTRAAHRQKRCVRLPATQPRPPASAAPAKRARRPTKSRRVEISGRAPNSLLRDSNSLLGIKFGSKIPCNRAQGILQKDHAISAL